MTVLAMIRHGRTAWNDDGRLTGRTDIPLSPKGRDEVAGYRLPDELTGAQWHVSPLVRARQTAELLGFPDAHVEQRLIEMDFGGYEGRTLAALHAELGAEMQANEDRGLDFQPPGGESPRAVQQRLQPWLRELAVTGGTHVAVAHKAVIRAIFAAAYDWPMLGKPPVRLQWRCAHLFALDADGRPSPARMNLSLVAA